MRSSLENEVRIIEKKINDLDRSESMTNDELHVHIASIITHLYRAIQSTVNFQETSLINPTVERLDSLILTIKRVKLEHFWQTVKGTFESKRKDFHAQVLEIYRV